MNEAKTAGDFAEMSKTKNAAQMVDEIAGAWMKRADVERAAAATYRAQVLERKPDIGAAPNHVMAAAVMASCSNGLLLASQAETRATMLDLAAGVIVVIQQQSLEQQS